jgi:hypothetical protein
MAEVRLTDEEAQALRRALQAFVARTRTGELGIMHGLDRFVSNQTTFRRPDLESLDSAARKLGLSAGVRRTEKQSPDGQAVPLPARIRLGSRASWRASAK